MGAAEIQDFLGVGRARAYQIARQKGFPDPVAELKMGSIWLAEDVEAWARQHRPDIAEPDEA